MHTLRETIYYFIELEFYESALLLSQFLVSKEDNHSNYILLLHSLYKLGYNEVMDSILCKLPELKKYKEVQILCAKCGIDVNICDMEQMEMISGPMFEITTQSLLYFYRGKTQSEKRRFDDFENALKIDGNNCEVIIYMFKEGMIGHKQFLEYLDNINIHEIKTALTELFITPIDNNQLLFNPLTHLYTKIYNDNIDFNQLFRNTIIMMQYFKNSEYCNFIVGLCYINKKQYREAKRVLTNATEHNEHFGMAQLYLGISCSLLRECDNAIKAYDKAYLICNNSPLPSYYLAHEYQTANRFNKAKFYYTISIKYGDMFKNNYAYYLMKKGMFKEAFELISTDNILNVYYLLSKDNNVKMAIKALKSVKVIDAQYYLIKGYLSHLQAKYDEAIDDYLECLKLESFRVAEELKQLAIENRMMQDKQNKALEYMDCLFDSLKYKDKTLFVFL